ncbi:MAG: sensor histidine kinase [Prevotella sp.]|nr:sensor histidine kinase [Prevotella sp.]
MFVFYMNYLWLTPHYFVPGRHRYYFIINFVVIISLGIGLHFWMDYSRQLFHPEQHYTTSLNTLGFILRDIFNLMISATIATLIKLSFKWYRADRIRRDEEAARVEAELNTLRWQISPHFLLNTLNNIYALTAFDTPKAQESIQELSKMLRHILYDNQQPTVPIYEEVEFMENYIRLMRIRLPKAVEIDAQFSFQNPQQQVAPMLFISLVENAFKHGVSPTQPSFIHLQMTADDDQIVFDITNSNYPKDQQDRSGHGVGLSQVQRRLDLTYPEQYVWEKGVSSDGKTYHSRIVITT